MSRCSIHGIGKCRAQRDAGYVGDVVCPVQLMILIFTISLIQSVSSPLGESTWGAQSLLEPLRDGEGTQAHSPRLERWLRNTVLEDIWSTCIEATQTSCSTCILACLGVG